MTTTPSDVPDDVMELAIKFEDEWASGRQPFPGDAIARAIMADRASREGWVRVPPGKAVMFVDQDAAGSFGTSIHPAPVIRGGEAVETEPIMRAIDIG